MKKRMIAAALLSTMFASHSANAITVYNKGDFTWKLKGDIQVQVNRDPGTDEDTEIEFDDGELKNTFTYELGSGLKAFAQLDYEFARNDGQTEEAYVGLKNSNYGFLIGNTDLPSDEFGHETQYEGPSFEDAFDATADSSDDQIQFFSKLGHGLELIIATDVAADASIEDGTDKVLVDAVLIGDYDNFDFQIAYQDIELDENLESIDTFGVAIGFGVGGVKLGIDYSENDVLEVLHLTAKVKASKRIKLAFGYEIAEEEGIDIDSWYTNLTYQFNKNVSLLGEIGETDEDGTDLGYTLGMRVKF